MRGFIALTSVLIISAVLLMLVVGTSTPLFYTRMNSLETEWRLESQFLAAGCVEVVHLRRAAQPDYAGGDTLQISGVPCRVGTTTVYIEYRGAVTVLPF